MYFLLWKTKLIFLGLKGNSMMCAKRREVILGPSFYHDRPLLVGQRTSHSVCKTCLHKLGMVHSWAVCFWDLLNMIVNEARDGSWIDKNWRWVIEDMLWWTRRPTGNIEPFFLSFLLRICKINNGHQIGFVICLMADQILMVYLMPKFDSFINVGLLS